MKKYLFKRALIILTLCTAVFLTFSLERAEAFEPWPIDSLIGNSAPEFSLENLDGKETALSSFKGKPVLLNFWATWCGYCRKERAHLNSLYEEYKDKGLVIIAVSIDRSLPKVKKFMKNVPSDFIVLFDSEGRAASKYNVRGLPSSVLIDREGVITHKFTGMRKWTDESSKNLIDKLVQN